MTPVEAAAAFWSRLQTLTQYDLLDGEIPETPDRPYVLFWSATGTPASRLLNGQAGASRLDHMLQHVVNHGSYHRGQVTTLLRQLGAAPPAQTDLIAFHRERGLAR